MINRDTLYDYLASAFRLILRTPGLSAPLVGFSRVLQRQSQTLRLLRHFQFDGVIDGGANIGEFAELVRMELPQANLLCIEPHPGCAQKLRRKGFQIIESALWSQSHLTLKLIQPSESSTSCRIGTADIQQPAWNVSTLRLDEVPIAGRKILVKLDLQGAEAEALAGMDRLWERCHGFIVETRVGPHGNASVLQKIFEAQGYSSYGILNQLYEGDVLSEVDQVWIR